MVVLVFIKWAYWFSNGKISTINSSLNAWKVAKTFKSFMTTSIFGQIGHVIMLLNIMLLVIMTSQIIRKTTNLPTTKSLLHINKLMPWTSLWIAHATCSSTRITRRYFVFCFQILKIQLVNNVKQCSFGHTKSSYQISSTYSITKKMVMFFGLTQCPCSPLRNPKLHPIL